MNFEQIEQYLNDTKSPVQLVKHYDDVKKKPAFPMWAQIKYDGVYCLGIRIGEEVRYYSRTGKRLFLNQHPPYLRSTSDGVYIGELVNPSLSLEQLSGLVNPNRKTDWTLEEQAQMTASKVYWHDALTFEEFLAGYTAVGYINRHARLDETRDHVIESTSVFNEEDLKAYFNWVVALEYEGVVVKNIHGDWKAGRRDGNAMKLVREVLVDLECIGVKLGKGKRENQVAALEFSITGDSTFFADFGEGWTDERRDALTQEYLTDPKTVLGRIWEVHGLQPSSTGEAIRLPKVLRVRDDKEVQDVVRD